MKSVPNTFHRSWLPIWKVIEIYLGIGIHIPWNMVPVDYIQTWKNKSADYQDFGRLKLWYYSMKDTMNTGLGRAFDQQHNMWVPARSIHLYASYLHSRYWKLINKWSEGDKCWKCEKVTSHDKLTLFLDHLIQSKTFLKTHLEVKNECAQTISFHCQVTVTQGLHEYINTQFQWHITVTEWVLQH